MDARSELADALSAVVGVLDRRGVRWVVGGSVASTIHGRFRATNDIDVVAELEGPDVAEFVSSLETDYYVDEGAVREAVRRRSSFNVVHLATGLKIDVFVGRDLPFDRSVRSRRVRTETGSESMPSMWIVSAEDSVLTKLDWFRRGGCVSERQWNDVLGVLQIGSGRLDEEYLRAWADRIGVADLFRAAMDGRPAPRPE